MSKSKVYYTMHGPKKPFMVKISNIQNSKNKMLEVMKPKNSSNPEIYDSLVLSAKVDAVMLGKCIFKTCDHSPDELGNTILAKLFNTNTHHTKPQQNRYLYIGEKVYEFETDSPIVEFGSPVGNGGYPSPYARTSGNKIILFEPSIGMVIEASILEAYKFNPRDIDNWDARDPYYYYWGKFEDDLKKQQKIEKDLFANIFERKDLIVEIDYIKSNL